MSKYVRAIETRYKGYRFRSRLEARWAVFFDALGNCWEYESETLRAGERAYLPDFVLESGLLVEIKPQELAVAGAITTEEQQRWVDASLVAKMPLLVLHGPPRQPSNNNALTGFGFGDGWLVDVDLGCCRGCGGFGFCHTDTGYWTLCKAGCEKERAPAQTDHYAAAIEASRGARFEWGEFGAPEKRTWGTR